MRKQLSLFVLAVAAFGISPVMAATNSGMRGASSADLTGAPGVRSQAKVDYEKYETRSSTKTYAVKDDKNIYYTQPASRGDMYKNAGTSSSTAAMRTTRTETAYREAKRKYFLAHPFFQPLEGKFGSITDVAYTTNSYDMSINTFVPGSMSDTKAAWDMSQISVKEDLSYGITDKFTILGMVRYASTDYTWDWSVAPDDTMKDSGVDIWGLGTQWRFVDNAEWIGLISGYYQHQDKISDNFIVDLKAGYKVARSTIYGLARGWLVNLDGQTHGNRIYDPVSGSSTLILYGSDKSSLSFLEAGIGLFSVLDEDWTLNLEGVLGSYSWHSQGSIKGAIGWQPGNSFALNLYAKTAIYDSMNDKQLGFYGINAGDPTWTHMGIANISNYSETSFGLQAIFLF